jgi:competence protein ComEA
MKKILFFMALSVSFLFSAINVQTASKDELMCIKGIGEKKATAILKYRKANKVTSADDLINIKGFGKGIIANVKAGKKSVACGGKKGAKKSSKKNKSKKLGKKDSKKDGKKNSRKEMKKEMKKSTSKKETSSGNKSEKSKKAEKKPMGKKTDSQKED